ncbi:MAG: hypothetical protein QXN21_05410, partial [Candidatus Bathyarchaeia archaeon]
MGVNTIYSGRIMEEKGVSPVISMVIITATLLVILVIASFFATNLLEIQIQNSEFEQAKTAMLLLDKTIMDVSLRRGAASSVQFNQRSGGLGIHEGDMFNITVLEGSNLVWSNASRSYVIKYRGGSMVSTAQMSLTDPGGLIVTDPSKSLGHVRIETGNGAWIVLDYNRMRVIKNLGTLDIYLIRLEPGAFGGSGTVSVRVQNRDIRVTSKQLSGPSNLSVHVDVDSQGDEWGPYS